MDIGLLIQEIQVGWGAHRQSEIQASSGLCPGSRRVPMSKLEGGWRSSLFFFFRGKLPLLEPVGGKRGISAPMHCKCHMAPSALAVRLESGCGPHPPFSPSEQALPSRVSSLSIRKCVTQDLPGTPEALTPQPSPSTCPT